MAASCRVGEVFHKVRYTRRPICGGGHDGASEHARRRPRLLARSVRLRVFQENIRRSGPAAAASYTLIGAILLLGGIGYALDAWRGTSPWFLLAGLLLGHRRRVLRAGQDRLATPDEARVVDGRAQRGCRGCVAAALSTRRRVSRFSRHGRAAGDGRSEAGSLMERTYRRNPERLTAVMIAAFAGKMVFFGAYVAVMLRVLSLRPDAVRGQLHELLHRVVPDRSAVPAAPVCGRPARRAVVGTV